MPRLSYDKVEDVPKELIAAYEQRDGKYIFRLEGDIPELESAKQQLATFRDNNKALNEAKVLLETKYKPFEGVDPKEIETLRTRVKDFEKVGGDAASVELRIRESVKTAVEEATSPLRKQLEETAKQKAESDTLLQRRDLESVLREAAVAAGILDTALPDYLARGTNLFALEKGTPIPKRNGDIVYGKKDVTKPMPVTEWIEELFTSAPHFFKQSKGSGAGERGVGGHVRTITGEDPVEFGRLIEQIAKGQVTVQR